MGATTDTIASNLIALGFDNTSDAAIYNKIAQAVGIPIDNTITEFANSEARILNIISTQRYGRAAYYTAAAKAFQYGDDLVVDPVTFDDVYAVINPLKQIISQAAFEDQGNGALFLKVATLDTVSGNLLALNADQLAAFKNYFVNYQIPGLPISIISTNPNVFSFNAVCTYQKTYDLSALKTNLQAALTTFRQTFAFDGELFIGDAADYMKANVPGLRDFYIFNTSLDGAVFAGSISLPAGYFNYPDPFATFFANNIVYAPV